MAKTKHAKPSEFEKEQIRSLERQNRQLRQRIKQLERYPKEAQEKESKRIKKEEDYCKECERGLFKEMEIAGRRFLICQVCKYRKKV